MLTMQSSLMLSALYTDDEERTWGRVAQARRTAVYRGWCFSWRTAPHHVGHALSTRVIIFPIGTASQMTETLCGWVGLGDSLAKTCVEKKNAGLKQDDAVPRDANVVGRIFSRSYPPNHLPFECVTCVSGFATGGGGDCGRALSWIILSR